MSSGRRQERRALIAVLVLAAMGAATAVLAAFKVTDPWVIGGTATGVAVVAVISGIWQERYKRITARRDENSLKLQDGCLVLPGGGLPKVAQLDDPVRLGVHPAIVLTTPDTKPPAYISRDVDEHVRERLTVGGFVLLVGDSTAGKSRTAYEAVRATLPDHVLIAPHDRTALLAAVESTARAGRAVLWLSDLEHYLGSGGLTREHVARLAAGKGHRVIVATMRSAEQARLTSPANDQDDSARSNDREVRETLEQAYTVRLERMFTTDELGRAQDCIWDARICSAVQQAGDFGIAEYLASGPELQRDYDNAWGVGNNPRGAALVAAAIDCRRAGYTSPAPRKLIEELHTAYLDAKGGYRLRPESLQEAWAWATRPRRATTALLAPIPDVADEIVLVFDYLVDLKQQTEGPLARISESLIKTVLEHIRHAEDAEQIASTADRQGRYHLAEPAWRTAFILHGQALGNEHLHTLRSWSNRAYALWRLGRLEESEAEKRAVLMASRRFLGKEHPFTLTSWGNLAGLLRVLGRLEEAEVEGRAVLDARRRVLGEEHADTLSSRNHLANVMRDLGRTDEAGAEFQAVWEARRRVLGEGHPDILVSRGNLASVLHDLGRLAEAEAEHRAVLKMRRRSLGEEHPDTLNSQNNLATTLRALGRLHEAEAEHRAVLEVRRRILGEQHPSTLMSRNDLANVLRDLEQSGENQTF